MTDQTPSRPWEPSIFDLYPQLRSWGRATYKGGVPYDLQTSGAFPAMNAYVTKHGPTGPLELRLALPITHDGEERQWLAEPFVPRSALTALRDRLRLLEREALMAANRNDSDLREENEKLRHQFNQQKEELADRLTRIKQLMEENERLRLNYQGLNERDRARQAHFSENRRSLEELNRKCQELLSENEKLAKLLERQTNEESDILIDLAGWGEPEVTTVGELRPSDVGLVVLLQRVKAAIPGTGGKTHNIATYADRLTRIDATANKVLGLIPGDPAVRVTIGSLLFNLALNQRVVIFRPAAGVEAPEAPAVETNELRDEDF